MIERGKMALPVQINPKHNKSTLERVCFYYGEIFIRGCLRGCIGGCIVELYQFRYTDESLPVRVFSGQEPVYVFRGGGQKISVKDIRTDPGQDRCRHRGAKSGYQAALCGYAQ